MLLIKVQEIPLNTWQVQRLSFLTPILWVSLLSFIIIHILLMNSRHRLVKQIAHVYSANMWMIRIQVWLWNSATLPLWKRGYIVRCYFWVGVGEWWRGAVHQILVNMVFTKSKLYRRFAFIFITFLNGKMDSMQHKLYVCVLRQDILQDPSL
jgi:hypothetical protein